MCVCVCVHILHMLELETAHTKTYTRICTSECTYISRCSRSHVLLGRKDMWPSGQYSVLAGFTEISESLEETVVREVAEESGVAVKRDSLEYFSSQVCMHDLCD